MSDQNRGRRDEVLAAAISVIGTAGVDGLTYRAVDSAANVPEGTTSNHFRNREALLLGVFAEVEKQRRAYWRELLGTSAPRTVSELADLVAEYMVDVMSMLGDRARAYISMLMEVQRHAALRELMDRSNDAQIERALAWLRAVNPDVPTLYAEIVMDYIAGVFMHELSNPAPTFDPRPGIGALLEGLIGLAGSRG